jgi:hypothetical protein
MADLEGSVGQVGADSAGTTAEAPTANIAGSEGSAPTSVSAPESAVESFFDPASIRGKPELESAYKQMQSAFTKRMQGVSQDRSKIDAYDQFSRDPVGTVQRIATQMGYKLVQPGNEQPKDWNPQTWDDVLGEAEKRVLRRMEPVYNELRDLKKQSVETYLDDKYADWRTYEDDMLTTLQRHPSLANDPDSLYRLSVPSEVWEARATKQAMEKLQQRTESGQVAGGTKTTRPVASAPSGPLSFDQAVDAARRKLAGMGLRPS